MVLSAGGGFGVFAGLGFGLALPFLLLGYVPALRRKLRSGAVDGALPPYSGGAVALTALGLAWILERQTGFAGLAVGLAPRRRALVLAWAGRRHGWLRFAPAALAAAAAVAFLPTPSAPAEARSGGALRAEPFSEARLAELRASGRPVFVYFTADWCLTCKVNEAAVLDQDEVAAAFRDGQVAVLVGDWTRAMRRSGGSFRSRAVGGAALPGVRAGKRRRCFRRY